jgi:hypothetical protein
MKTAKIISGIVAILMAVGIVYSLIVGDFGGEGSVLLGLTWGKMSMLDLYSGFTLFSLWIAFREKQGWQAALWIFFMMTLGFLTGAVYVWNSLRTSGDDWNKFFMGARATR